MAISNTNASPVSFQNGGRFIIETASSTYVNVLNIGENGGDLRITPGVRGVNAYNDRNTPQIPINGAQGRSMIELSNVKHTTAYTTNELLSYFRQAPSGAQAKYFKLHVEIPDYPGATAGLRYTFNYCTLNPGSLSIVGGGEFDLISMSFTDHELMPDPVRYTTALA